MPKQEAKIRTLAEFIAAVRRLAPETGHYWFRGQSSSFDDILRPLLYRKEYRDSEEALYEEDMLRSEFMRLGRQVAGGAPRDFWEWYFLMQHFGVPTRLLDWTDNALAALHFAVSEDAPVSGRTPKKREDPVVYALDPDRLNKETFRRAFRGSGTPHGVIAPDWDAAQR
jgi:hypothetical protein